ncbi:MAG: type I methionyl aminopeptidase [Patescibacteria group bacterium]
MIVDSSKKLNDLRESGRILKNIVSKLKSKTEIGISAYDLDKLAQELTKKAGVKPAFLGYNNFPNALCVCINEEVAHGIPRRDKIIKAGDIVSLDYGIIYKGVYTDHAISFTIGNSVTDSEKLVKITEQAMYKGIDVVKTGIKTGDIGFAIESFIKKESNYGIIKRLVGHGLGDKVHEDPHIPNFGKKGYGSILREGEVIAIEPIIALGSGDIKLDKDKHTYITKDRTLSAHFEHTILVKKDGYEIIT